MPAGAALAVDRHRFSAATTAAIEQHPLITVVREEITAIPQRADAGSPVIIATGPLTAPALSAAIADLVGQAHLYFYDAISPIVRHRPGGASRLLTAWTRLRRNVPAGWCRPWFGPRSARSRVVERVFC